MEYDEQSCVHPNGWGDSLKKIENDLNSRAKNIFYIHGKN